MDTNLEQFSGRLLLKKDLKVQNDFVSNFSELDIFTDEIHKISGMLSVSASKILCCRCGTIHQKKAVQLPIGSFYCPACLNLGRVRSDEFLYHFPQKKFPARSYLMWTGTLTHHQALLSQQLVQQLKSPSRTLLEAVTGAGKTEIIYAAIDAVLQKGGAVGLASPRIDVCLELHKRLSRDFSCTIPLLYAGGGAYFSSPLVITSSHQLLRFKEAFDLLIIDEVDAFPLVDNEMLYFAAKNACKPQSNLLYLTATSTDKLDQQVKKGQLTRLTLAHRFHGNPLMVPQLFWQSKWKKEFLKQRKTGFPLLIFVPEIEFGKQFLIKLQKQFPDEKMAFVASTSKDRVQLVEAFRQGALHLLVSTSILERGVTFPCVDVFIIDASHPNFTKSALVQMAGRVGRSPKRPAGRVAFFHTGKSRAMVKAIHEIKKMNKKGGF